ncbi:DUF3857 domain-containing protein [Sphingomonas sp. BK580]|uniref:DUF3857 domain-containing protein n=1 Tax=Sphingomonas sp. BK580 TaxID=2586972 RepID=UPI001615FD68|nr:DUF3857 domain-containing protein [Sphingomonas sp. BK580]MBB3691543.1 tetratricopeptide (TPR) repeat protein/transglutaminase-like putative cysteine protease [Sphingomonas sp. BK580]
MRRGAFVAALLVGVAVGTAAHAGDRPIYQSPPAWVVPAPAIDTNKLTESSPILLRLDNQQRLEGGRVWSYVDSATRAASSQQLAEIGNIKLPWQPSQGDLVIHAVEIIRGSQRIDLVKGRSPFTVLRRETELDQRMMDGMLTATLAAEGLAVGDVLRVAFSVTRSDPTLAGNVQSAAPLLAQPAPIGFGRVRLSWPETSDIRWKAYADGVNAKPVSAGGYRTLDVALPLAKQPELPDDAPARFRKLPLLEATSFADWSAVSKAMAPLYATDGSIAAGSPLAAEVRRIERAKSTPLERAALAVQLVQEKISYLMLGMDTGNYVPQTPAQTWERRYGDCKAKTLLLLAVLRALQIEAEPVAANLQMGDMAAERLPSLSAFNHVLVRATIDGKSYWLDGTGAGTRLADLGDTPRLGSVLPLRPAGAALMPVLLHADARPDLTIAVDLDDRGALDTPSIVKAAITLRGGLAEQIGTAAAQASQAQRAEMVRRLLGQQVGNGNYIDPVIRYDPAEGVAVVSATGLASTRWARRDGRYRLVLDAAVGKLDFAPDRARAAWKSIPVALPGPASIVYRTTLHLPDGGRGFTLDGDRALPEALAGTRLKRSLVMNGDTVTIEDRIDQVGGEIEVASIPSLRAAVSQARGRLLTVLAPTGPVGTRAYYDGARKAGALAPTDAMFARVVADDPKDADALTWRARYRAATGDRAGGIADYGGAITIEPSTDRYLARAALYAALGDETRQHADLEAAYTLDPEADEVLGALANYRANHGDGDGAIALLDRRIERAGSKDRYDWIVTKAGVMADAGQRDAALAMLDTVITERPGNAGLLNMRCWLRGTGNVALEAGLKDCTKAIELADDPDAALDSRAMIYYRMNRFEDALADVGAALTDSPDLAASLYMRGVLLGRLGRRGESEAELAKARLVYPQIDRDYRRYGIAP